MSEHTVIARRGIHPCSKDKSIGSFAPIAAGTQKTPCCFQKNF
jgi:hypothetical protein